MFKEYRREYKRRFAWIKAGRIEPSAFYAWSAEAREKKAGCEGGRITLPGNWGVNDLGGKIRNGGA